MESFKIFDLFDYSSLTWVVFELRSAWAKSISMYNGLKYILIIYIRKNFVIYFNTRNIWMILMWSYIDIALL
jgi:hypothetical protein